MNSNLKKNEKGTLGLPVKNEITEEIAVLFLHDVDRKELISGFSETT